MKRADIFIKLALGFAAASAVVIVLQFIFVLLPIYSLAGLDTDDQNADARLDVLADRAHILSWLLYTLLGATLVLLFVGILKITRKKKHASR